MSVGLAASSSTGSRSAYSDRRAIGAHAQLRFRLKYQIQDFVLPPGPEPEAAQNLRFFLGDGRPDTAPGPPPGGETENKMKLALSETGPGMAKFYDEEGPAGSDV